MFKIITDAKQPGKQVRDQNLRGFSCQEFSVVEVGDTGFMPGVKGEQVVLISSIGAKFYLEVKEDNVFLIDGFSLTQIRNGDSVMAYPAMSPSAARM